MIMRDVTTLENENHRYIICDDAISGGVPIIQGTRIRVIQIAQEYVKLGYSPDDIIRAHPHLTLAQVHDALSYYFEHKDEFEKKIEKSLTNYEREKKNSTSRLKTYLERQAYVEDLQR